MGKPHIALTIFCFLPHDALKVDACPRFAGAQALGLCGQSHITCVDPN